MRIIFLVLGALFAGCVNVDNVCPHKPITQGVFGEVTDSNGALEQNVDVSIYTLLNGVQDALVATAHTSRGGYQFNMDPGSYVLCAKSVCTTVTVPTGLVELSATDAAAGLTWAAPVGVPPAQMIGPCKFGE
jgi:uncharacterized membrane protein